MTAATTTGPAPAATATAAELHRSVGLDAAATAGLALYSFVASLGYARVFADWQFVADVAVVVIVGHGLSFLLRRLRVPIDLGIATDDDGTPR